MKRRVKPTLVTHIGLPQRQEHFNAKVADDPVLTRSIRAETQTCSGQQRTSLPISASPMNIKVTAENERRLTALAVYLIKSKRGYQGYMELCEQLLGLLRVLHQVYHQDENLSPGPLFLAQQQFAFPSSIESIEDLFSDTFLPIFFGIELLKGLFSKICKLTPSLVPAWEVNNCVRRLCPKIFIKAAEKSRNSLNNRPSLPRSEGRPSDFIEGAPMRDVFDAIAYADKRDSRNFSDQPVFYSNQQKVRDLFLEFVRATGSDFLPLYSQQQKDLGFKVREIMKNLAPENYSWFADLLVHQYDQMRKRMDSQPVLPMNQAKLERLEERLTKSSSESRPDIQNSGIVQFIKIADSHKLHRKLVLTLEKKIADVERMVIDGRRINFIENAKKLMHLARLYSILNSLEDEHNIQWIAQKIGECIGGSFTVLRLPWIIAYLQTAQPTSFAEPAWTLLLGHLDAIESSTDLNRKDFIISHLIRTYCPLEKRSIKTVNSEVATFNNDLQVNMAKLSLLEPVDNDFSLDLEQLLIPECQAYMHLLGLLKSFKKFEPGPSPTRQPPTLKPDTQSDQQRFTRKIRPITVESTSPKEEKLAEKAVEEPAPLQQQLRHWYWWQWPDLKDMIDTLVRYAVTETVKAPNLGDEHERIEHLKTVISACLPPLLPEILRSQERSINVAVALSLEKAVEVLKTHQ